MEIVLQPRQSVAFNSTATEILYGGAAFGGKSLLLRVSGIRWCLDVPGIQVYLFRRTSPDLRNNHQRGPKSIDALLAEYLRSGHVKYKGQENEYHFWNGSIYHLCYCQYERDVESYQGAEIHVLQMDELTHFTDFVYRFLRRSVRCPGLVVPEKYKGRLPRIECGSNPGSVGHAAQKARFVSPKPPEEIWRAPEDDGGMLRQYIPAKLADNPIGLRDDPGYPARLAGLGSPALVRAQMEGDWDIVAGQALEKLRRDVHGLKPFPIPADWIKFRSMDWGSTKPFSIGWWAVSDGTLDAERLDGNRILIPRGALVRYREWYGWNGNADQGLRMEIPAVAEGIRNRSQGEKYAYTVADASLWKVDGGPSHAQKFADHGVPMTEAASGPGSRRSSYQEMRSRIGNDPPMLYAFDTCHDGFWRTLPDLVLDEAKPEDVDTDTEDHCFDECKYACMSRKLVKDKKKEDDFLRPLRYDNRGIV